MGDLIFAALAFYVLLPADSAPAFPVVFAAFTVAMGLALMSNVPAGLGVFDGVMLLALPSVAAPEMVAALLMFRVIYFGLPFALALALFLYIELQSIGAPRAVVALARLARRVAARTGPAPCAGLAAVRPLLARSTRAEAELALSGDKRFFMNAEGDAFLMYRVRGRSWVAVGDPVGPAHRHGPLIADFHKAALAAWARPVLYKIGAHGAAGANATGLTTAKLGEEAVVDLSRFTRKGSKMSNLRRKLSKAERAGARFQMLAEADLPAAMETLERISDEWLIAKQGDEKRFSMGAFDAQELAHRPVGVIWVEDRIVAFGSLWRSGDGREAAIDLMRHEADAPDGAMYLLLTGLIEWSAEQGFQEFNLCMAPFSGLEEDAIQSPWARIGETIYRRGEKHYGFQGLRRFKGMFRPEWRPRYVAAPAGLSLAAAMVDVFRLVSGMADRRAARPLGRPLVALRPVLSQI
jgi:lysylphosphatidylglycerol synthetase-like protein (DUF2156 family)